MSDASYDVAVIGGGPSGLAAAAALKMRGVERVVVIEREASAGGVPRHCGHPPFGMREFGRILTGPAYARRLAAMAERSGAEVRTRTAVTMIEPGDINVTLQCTVPEGVISMTAGRVLLATGTRESPRSTRFTSGERPLGVINTGALQAYAYLEHLVPFRRPVIIGTELVALSAILTCRSLGAHPVAMIEEGLRPTAPSGMFLYPRALGIPVLTRTKLVEIAGSPRVEHVVVEDENGGRRQIDCDGVIFSGRFVGEAHLARMAGLDLDQGTGGPEVDQFGRTSHRAIFATGNLLRPVETAGWSFREGRRIGGCMADDIAGRLGAPGRERRLTPGDGVKYVMPQWLAAGSGGMEQIQLRVSRPVKGYVVAQDAGGREIFRQKLSALPERRVLLPRQPLAGGTGRITLKIVE